MSNGDITIFPSSPPPVEKPTADAQFAAFASSLGYDAPAPDAPAEPPSAPPSDEPGEVEGETAIAADGSDDAKERAREGYKERRGAKKKLEEAEARALAAEQQVQQLAYQQQQMAAYLQQQAMAQRVPQSPPPPPAPPADLPDDSLLDTDPATYIKQMKAALAEQKAWRDQQQAVQAQYQQSMVQQQAMQQFVGILGQAEAEYVQEHPDYPEQYASLKENLAHTLMEAGVPAEYAAEMAKSQILQGATYALQNRLHPAKYIAAWAHRLNGTIPQKAADAAFAAARAAVASGDAGTIGQGAGGNSALPSPATIASRGLDRATIKAMKKEVGLNGVLNSIRQAQRINR